MKVYYFQKSKGETEEKQRKQYILYHFLIWVFGGIVFGLAALAVTVVGNLSYYLGIYYFSLLSILSVLAYFFDYFANCWQDMRCSLSSVQC